MKDDDIYFAGFFDGEGCIQIWKRPPGPGRPRPEYRLAATIAGIDRRPLDRLVEVYGVGKVYKSARSRLSLSQAYQWVAVCKGAAHFLRAIQPYAMVKSEEIAVAMEYQSDVQAKKGGRMLHSDETLAFRESCRIRLQELKRRFRFHP